MFITSTSTIITINFIRKLVVTEIIYKLNFTQQL